jgi:integrase
MAALDILAPFCGVSLIDAAKYYASHHVTILGSKSVSEAITKLLKAKEANGMSPRYLKDLRVRLSRFAEDFGERKISDLGAPEIGDWLRALSLAALGQNTYYLRLSLLFSFAIEQCWVTVSPLSKSMLAKVRDAEPGILSPGQFASLLTNAASRTLPYWALGGFAGIRSAELERLEWSDIDFEHKLIEINPRKAKTASRRLVEICEALLVWLAPYRGSRGPVCPRGLAPRLLADRARAGLTHWPSNALRHSYASYFLEMHNDAAKLALQMGHANATMIFNHYRQRVRPEAARAWWSIMPPQSPNNIVELQNAAAAS